MSKFVFKPNDVFTNRIKTHPQCDFFIYSGSVYINNITQLTGTNLTGSILSTSGSGYISLYEMNIDRSNSTNAIGALIFSDSKKTTFRKNLRQPNVYKFSWPGNGDPNEDVFDPWVDDLYPNISSSIGRDYPLSASISRKLTTVEAIKVDPQVVMTDYYRTSPLDIGGFMNFNRTGSALSNIARKYTRLSKHFVFTPTGSHRAQLYADRGGYGTNVGQGFLQRDLTKEDINMIFIPSIFYGSTIKKGSVTLKYYITGSSTAEASDEKRNGELIGTSGNTSGSVVGIVMYDEGIILLTSSVDLETGPTPGIKYDGSTAIVSSWMYFGTSLGDGIYNHTLGSSSFGLSFQGTNYVNTMTMFCHAKKGELNYSNNPTFKKNSEITESADITSPHNFFSEQEVGLKNITTSSYTGVEEDFRKTIYISKVGVYDENGNLIMVANTSYPIKKTEDTEYTFKLKIDL